MKRTFRLLIVLALCLFTILPTTAFATTFTCYDVGISMDFEEDYWYVFTRDNLEGNPELDELGVSYDYMYSFFQDNNVHLNAITLYDDGTYLEIVFQEGNYISQVEDLSSYSDSDVLDFASGVAQAIGVSAYDTATIGGYKYAVLEYISDSIYFHEYRTIVDHYAYGFAFSSPASFTADQYDEIYTVMSSISFDDYDVDLPSDDIDEDLDIDFDEDLDIGLDEDVDTPAVSVPTIGISDDDSSSDSDPTASSSSDDSKNSKSSDNDKDKDKDEDEDEDEDKGKDEDDTLMKSILLGVLIGAVVGGVSGLVALLLRKKKTKKANAAADYPPAGSAYVPYGDPQPPVPNPYGYPQPPAQNPYGQPQPPAQNPYGQPQPPAQNPYGSQPPAQNPYGYPQAPSGYHNQPQGQHNRPDGQHNYR